MIDAQGDGAATTSHRPAMTPSQIGLALLVPLLWGLQFAIMKMGLRHFPPLFFLALRFTAISVLLLPFVRRPGREALRRIAAISFFIGGVNFSLGFIGLAHGSAGIASLANQLSTPFTVLLAWPLLGERVSPAGILGVAVALVGVALTVADFGSGDQWVATLEVALGALALGVGNVLAKRFGPFEPLMLMAWVSVFTVPQVLLASLVLEHGQLTSLQLAPLSAWLAFGYSVVFAGIAGFGLWFYLITHGAISRVAPFALLQSVFAVAAATLFLQEPFTFWMAGGMLLCLAGVGVSQIRR